jgi:hypothetical protein
MKTMQRGGFNFCLFVFLFLCAAGWFFIKAAATGVVVVVAVVVVLGRGNKGK